MKYSINSYMSFYNDMSKGLKLLELRIQINQDDCTCLLVFTWTKRQEHGHVCSISFTNSKHFNNSKNHLKFISQPNIWKVNEAPISMRHWRWLLPFISGLEFWRKNSIQKIEFYWDLNNQILSFLTFQWEKNP